jgi:CrcB protein
VRVADGRQIAAVYAGGAVGSVARAMVGQALPWTVGDWPWATFVVNVVGCALLGYFTTRLQEQLPVSAYRRPLLGSGLCGGLTTFSTLQLELLRMLDARCFVLATAYGVVSVVTGFAAVHLATVLVRRVRVRVAP